MLYKNREISVVYFRSGYVPEHFQTEADWLGREKIELSMAVKCPNIDFHIAGCKKIQQCLAKDMADFTFFSEELSENTTEIYDFSETSDEVLAQVVRNPSDWVLKPQREGGGNNTYGLDILPYLANRKSLKEFILMKMIRCQEKNTWTVRNGVASMMSAVSEVGMFGVIVGKGKETYLNEYAGYLIRTKSVNSNEGGVAAGYAVIDSASLI